MARRPGVDYEIRGRDRTKAAFASAQRGLQGLIGSGGRLGGLLSRGGPIGIGLASVTAAAFLAARAMSNLAQRMDDIANTSARVGVAADALQAFRLTGEIGGARAREVDLGLQRFARRAGEAANGGGEFLKTAERLNIQFRDSAGNMRPVIELMDDLIIATRKLPSVQEQLVVGFKAMDSEGAKFFRTLVDSNHLPSELAAALGENFIASERVVESGSKVNRQLSLLSSAWSTAGANLGTAFMPVFQELITALIAAAGHVNKLAEGLQDLFDVRDNEGLRDLIEDLEDQEEALQRTIDNFNKLDPRQRRARGFDTLADAEAKLARVRTELAEKRAMLEEAIAESKEEQLVSTEAIAGAEGAATDEKEAQADVELTLEQRARKRLEAGIEALRLRQEELRIARALSGLPDVGSHRRAGDAPEQSGDANAPSDEAVTRAERLLDVTRQTADALAGGQDSFEGWLRTAAELIRLFQQFDFGGGGGSLIDRDRRGGRVQSDGRRAAGGRPGSPWEGLRRERAVGRGVHTLGRRARPVAI